VDFFRRSLHELANQGDGGSLSDGGFSGIFPRMIYLDHNATTPMAPEIREAMLPFLTEQWGNPSTSYRFGSKLKGVIETARGQLGELIGASPRDVILTSCAKGRASA